MSLNLVIPNKDNKVVFVFTGIDLTLATDIQIAFGSESYSLLADPTLVSVTATELSLDLSGTAEVGMIFATVTYIDGGSVNGTDITSRELGNSDKIIVAIGSQLIIEDGTVVAAANSFVTDAEFKTYTDINNKSVPSTQPEREALLVGAYNYLNVTYEQMTQGCRASALQTGFFPRNYVYAYGYSIANTVIPEDVKTAQILTALAINNGADTNTIVDSANLASFTVVGVYAETYKAGSNTPDLPRLPAVTRQLKAYSNSNSSELNRSSMGYLP